MKTTGKFDDEDRAIMEAMSQLDRQQKADGDNPWHAYERFKAAFRDRFGFVENTADYDAAIKAYCKRWSL